VFLESAYSKVVVDMEAYRDNGKVVFIFGFVLGFQTSKNITFVEAANTPTAGYWFLPGVKFINVG